MRDRFVTAAIGIPIVLACVFVTSPWPIGILAVIVAALGLIEAMSLARERIPWTAAAVVAIVILSSSAFRYYAKKYEVVEAAVLLLALHAAAVGATGWGLANGKRALYAVGAALYVCLPMVGIVNLHQLNKLDPLTVEWNPWSGLLMLLIPIWAADTAAIFVGKYLGRRKLAESISPNKTWEGAAGNFVAAVGVGAGLAAPLGFPVGVGLVCGAICGLLGQAGDLFESWLKRRAGIKDSGTLLPGHGGILDRVDSLLFTAIPVLLVLLIARHGYTR